MNKREFSESVKQYQDNLGKWKIEIDCLSEADFVLGYGFDEKKNQWRVYENNERGIKYEWIFGSEEEALKKLQKKIKFRFKMIN